MGCMNIYRSHVPDGIPHEFLGTRDAGRRSSDDLSVRYSHVLVVRLSRSPTGECFVLEDRIVVAKTNFLLFHFAE